MRNWHLLKDFIIVLYGMLNILEKYVNQNQKLLLFSYENNEN